MQNLNSPARRRAQAGRLPHEHPYRAWARRVALLHRAIVPGPCAARDNLELLAEHNPLTEFGPVVLVRLGFALLDSGKTRAPAACRRLRAQIECTDEAGRPRDVY